MLDKLFVEIPSQEFDGLVFIDTPGYNNSDKANLSNGKTDRQTALEALDEGNVLFWLVDCERGTTVSNDIEFIKHFKGKKVIIFNKADKKGEKECVKIVEEAARTLYKEFPKEDIIDIIAFSTLDNKIYYSKNRKTLNDIVRDAKKSGSGTSKMETLIESLKSLFDNEITASKNIINDIEQNYKEKQEWKNNSYECFQNSKNDKEYIMDELRAMLVQSYNDVLKAADDYFDSSKYALDAFASFFDSVVRFETTDHWGSSTILTNAIKKADKEFDRAANKHNAINFEYYNEDSRQNLVKKIEDEENIVIDHFKNWYEEECESCENALNGKAAEEKLIKDMSDYKRIFMAAVDSGINEYRKKNKASSIQRQELQIPNVFECIKTDNYKYFLHCFVDGVDMTVCNADGYSPLTLAVLTGNNAMVQFLLAHGADPSVKDRRGYNAFHTAVENQYRDICKILLDNDPDLIDTETASGESVEDLAKKQTFMTWIEDEIINAI